MRKQCAYVLSEPHCTHSIRCLAGWRRRRKLSNTKPWTRRLLLGIQSKCAERKTTLWHLNAFHFSAVGRILFLIWLFATNTIHTEALRFRYAQTCLLARSCYTHTLHIVFEPFERFVFLLPFALLMKSYSICVCICSSLGPGVGASCMHGTKEFLLNSIGMRNCSESNWRAAPAQCWYIFLFFNLFIHFSLKLSRSMDWRRRRQQRWLN